MCDPVNNSLPDVIQGPLQCTRILIPRGFYVDICLGLRKSWPLVWPHDQVHDIGGQTHISTSDGTRVLQVVFVCSEPPVGFNGEVAALLSEVVIRKNGDCDYHRDLKSVDGSCAWKDCEGLGFQSSASSTLIEISWESLGARTGHGMVEEGGGEERREKERRGEEGKGGKGGKGGTGGGQGGTSQGQVIGQEGAGQGARSTVSAQRFSPTGRGNDDASVALARNVESIRPGGDGVWTCIGCGSDGLGMVLHVCGCRACEQCYWAKNCGRAGEDGNGGGCGETKCAKNLVGVDCSVSRGEVLVLPDGGRGRRKWEEQGHAWGDERFMLFKCSSDIVERVRSSAEPPLDAMRSILAEGK